MALRVTVVVMVVPWWLSFPMQCIFSPAPRERKLAGIRNLGCDAYSGAASRGRPPRGRRKRPTRRDGISRRRADPSGAILPDAARRTRMVNESSPVQTMSAQRPAERGDEVIERLSRELERGGRSVADDSRIADAASWALEKATDALHSAALYLRDQAAAVVAKPVRRDPVRAVLIA